MAVARGIGIRSDDRPELASGVLPMQSSEPGDTCGRGVCGGDAGGRGARCTPRVVPFVMKHTAFRQMVSLSPPRRPVLQALTKDDGGGPGQRGASATALQNQRPGIAPPAL